MLKTILIPIHSAGWPFIWLFAAVSVGLFVFAVPLGMVGVILTFWCIYFFRDPNRVTPSRSGLIISPADGVVQLIDTAIPPAELKIDDSKRVRVCIFMNVFNVHVNRVPCDGIILKIAYRAGRFFNASLDKASNFNERCSILQKITLNNGVESNIVYVQIAGLIARRIKCDVIADQAVKAGQRFGIIRFGSRVDVYLPPGVEPFVTEGQHMIAGETVIADFTSSEPQRRGEVR